MEKVGAELPELVVPLKDEAMEEVGAELPELVLPLKDEAMEEVGAELPELVLPLKDEAMEEKEAEQPESYLPLKDESMKKKGASQSTFYIRLEDPDINRLILKLSPLHQASWLGNLEEVEELVRDGGDVNSTGGGLYRSETPFYCSVWNGHLKIVKFMVEEKKADLNFQNKKGFTAVNAALWNRRHEVATFLIQLPEVDINTRSNEGYTPLMSACMKSTLINVKLLLIKNIDRADVNAYVNAYAPGANPSNASPDPDGGWTALYAAAERYGTDYLKELRSYGADLKRFGEGTLIVARNARKQNTPGMEYLQKEMRPEPVPPNNYLLCNSFDEAMEEKGAQQPELYLPLEDKDIDSKICELTRLHQASWLGNSQEVQELVSEGGDVNSDEHKSLTPFYCSAWRGHFEIVKFMVEHHGAHLNVQSYKGFTPVNAAVWRYYDEVATFLVKKGADINIASSEGYTPLMLACIKSPFETVQLLLEYGADVNACTKTNPRNSNDSPKGGWTALHTAAECSVRIEKLKALVEFGADLKIFGEGALNVARVRGNGRGEAYLKSVMPRQPVPPN